MPGLKALTDRLPTGDVSRSVTLYTSSFSIGVGLSFLVSQIIAETYGWRAAFTVTGIAPLAMVIVSFMLAPFKPKPLPVIRSTSVLCSAIVLHSDTFLGMALIALNYTGCALGSSRSGHLWLRDNLIMSS